MPQRIIQILAPAEHDKTLAKITERAQEDYGVQACWQVEVRGDRTGHAFLVDSDKSQPVIDLLQPVLDRSEEGRILILPVEASLPKPKAEESSKKRPAFRGVGRISREELYNDVTRGATLDGNFLLLVVFSTLTATVGLLEDNVAVLVGAMVIAPFLGPNLALAFATTLGDASLMSKAVKTNLAGVCVTLLLACLVGYYWPEPLDSHELLTRTEASLSSLFLALAGGAAAVLSLTTGISSVLVGVMVAVALLPPATTLGIMLGAGDLQHAQGAALLLGVNVVCVNLAAGLVFLAKGLSPRSWYDKEKARRATLRALAFWALLLAALATSILLQ